VSSQTADRAEVLVTVVEILAGVLSVPGDAISPDADLADLGWDSMAMLETIVAMEARLGTEIDLRALRSVHTAHDLVTLARP
jgi:acyl carrier protein